MKLMRCAITISLFLGYCDLAIAQYPQWLQCVTQSPTIPSGSLVSYTANNATCGLGTFIVNGRNTQSNQLGFYPPSLWHSMPLGYTITVCSETGIPSGWQLVWDQGQYSTCNNLGDEINIQHVSCGAGDTNCSPSGRISASPQSVYIPYGQLGSTTLTFSSSNISGSTCWWVSVDSAAATNGPCYTGNQSSRTDLANWIQAGHQYVFYLYEEQAHILLGQVAVQGVSDGTPAISVSPNPAIILAGEPSAPITISWNAPGYSSVSLYGTNNLPPYNGATICLASGLPANDSISGHAYPGEVAHGYIVNNDGCTPGAVVSSVPGLILADVGFGAQ